MRTRAAECRGWHVRRDGAAGEPGQGRQGRGGVGRGDHRLRAHGGHGQGAAARGHAAAAASERAAHPPPRRRLLWGYRLYTSTPAGERAAHAAALWGARGVLGELDAAQRAVGAHAPAVVHQGPHLVDVVAGDEQRVPPLELAQHPRHLRAAPTHRTTSRHARRQLRARAPARPTPTRLWFGGGAGGRAPRLPVEPRERLVEQQQRRRARELHRQRQAPLQPPAQRAHRRLRRDHHPCPRRATHPPNRPTDRALSVATTTGEGVSEPRRSAADEEEEQEEEEGAPCCAAEAPRPTAVSAASRRCRRAGSWNAPAARGQPKVSSSAMVSPAQRPPAAAAAAAPLSPPFQPPPGALAVAVRCGDRRAPRKKRSGNWKTSPLWRAKAAAPPPLLLLLLPPPPLPPPPPSPLASSPAAMTISPLVGAAKPARAPRPPSAAHAAALTPVRVRARAPAT
eukprot:scaffold4753_cov266-Prasinococcus_capsulatus_cf.AAC.1